MRKAREQTGLKVAEFAQLIEVSAKTINNAESGKHAVRPITIKAWALGTGVNRHWLETGEGSPTSPEGLPEGDPETELARLANRKRAQRGAPRANHRYDRAA